MYYVMWFAFTPEHMFVRIVGIVAECKLEENAYLELYKKAMSHINQGYAIYLGTDCFAFHYYNYLEMIAICLEYKGFDVPELKARLDKLVTRQ